MITTGKSIYEGFFLEAINNYAGHHPALDEFMRVLVAAGVLPLVILIVVFACCSKDAWRRKGGWISLAGAVLAVGITLQLDSILARPRPFLNHHVRLLIACPDSLSFPSAEMAASAAIAFGLFAYASKSRLLPMLYLLIIGFARVYCGLEYPLDQCWAVIIGTLSVLAVILLFDHSLVFKRLEGWPISIVGVTMICAAMILAPHTPRAPERIQQSTYAKKSGKSNIDDRNIIKGLTPTLERKLADALLKLHLPGPIRKVEIGSDEFTQVAAVKFGVGFINKQMPKGTIEKEALAIIKSAFKTLPKVNEVDIFSVVRGVKHGKPALIVVYSVTAKRDQTLFMFKNQQAKLNTDQALSRFGSIYYRNAMEMK